MLDKLEARYWILDAGCWILDSRYWILDVEFKSIYLKKTHPSLITSA